MMTRPVDIIVPIYNQFAAVKACIRSVLAAGIPNGASLILMNDASSDAALNAWLREMTVSDDRIHLVEQIENKGFVASVNHGMSLFSDHDVVLLNSDTRVSGDWLERMSACAWSHPAIGTVTPFSNNATICSYPLMVTDNPLPEGVSEADMDAVFKRMNTGMSVEIPTAVGFCMYIKRDCLNAVGLFDEAAFGKGYGEENDFCMRAKAAGWTHHLCGDTFVYHQGGTSFGDRQKKRIAHAMNVLNQRYPDYPALIQSHIRENPAAHFRWAVRLEQLARASTPKVLFISHNMGGGTERYVEELISALGDKMLPFQITCKEGLRVSLYFPPSMAAQPLMLHVNEDRALLVQILRQLRISQIHVNHILGVPNFLLSLGNALDVPVDITLHDYYFINANPTLINPEGRYCGHLDTCDADCEAAYPSPAGFQDAVDWRQRSRRLLNAARRVFCPSRAAADIIHSYFPEVTLEVLPHLDVEAGGGFPDVVRKPLSDDAPLKILVLGAISREKGADILEQVAMYAAKQGAPVRFHLLGYAYRALDASVITHGPYAYAEAVSLIHEIDPHIVWFPALWPETYSYTLSEALFAGVPVAVPDIGAFQERVSGRPLSFIFQWDADVTSMLSLFLDIRDHWASWDPDAGGRENRWQMPPQDGPRYQTDFLLPSESLPPARLPEPVGPDQFAALINKQRGVLAGDHTGQTKKERVLTALLRLRNLPVMRKITQRIPFHWQRAIKRRLSSRPVHEYMR